MQGLQNSYIDSFIFISHFSQQASCCDVHVYAFMVVTMKKWDKLQLEYRVLLSFVIAQRCHKFRFLNSLITRAPSSGNWCRYLLSALH